MLVASGILSCNLLWLLDEELTPLDDLFRIDHIVDSREEHGQLIRTSDEGELESDFFLRNLEELCVCKRKMKAGISLYQFHRAEEQRSSLH